MKENRLSTPYNRVAFETLLGFCLVMHVQNYPSTLDAGHVDNLNEGEVLH